MRCIVGLTLVAFALALIAPQAAPAAKTYPYPVAPIKERFSFYRTVASLPVAVVDRAGGVRTVRQEVPAWRMYLKHQTLRGYMDLAEVSVLFVDAKGARFTPRDTSKRYDPELHRLIVEAVIDVASVKSPARVIIDTPERRIVYDVTAIVARAQ